MATSSSDESSSAPRDFHLSSSLDSGSRLSPNRQRCPLCCSYKKVFYCKECIQGGSFTYSSPHYPDSYVEKYTRLLKYKAYKKQIEDECLPAIDKKQRVDALYTKIRQKKDKIKVLKLALAEKKECQQFNNYKLKDLQRKNEMLSDSLPKYERQVQKLESYVLSKQDDIIKSRSDLTEKQLLLKKLILVRIRQITKYIFPITKVQARIEMEASESDMVSALEEATRTTYVRNRWVYNPDNAGELQYTVVAPSLPGSGNYSAYNDWVAQNKDAVPSSSSVTSVEQNPAYRISAALTYTAQLVHVLAFYLDVKLPYKLLYSDFCSSDMSEQQFNRRVARLNANVLHLCFSQNTDLNLLQPSQTLHNILQLLDPKVTDLGRSGPVEVDAQTAYDLEQQIASDLQTSEDSDSEESDTVPYEWEAVPRVQISDTTAAIITLQSTQTIPAQQANSMTGGLMNSAAAAIASMWKGWTGR
ncbi:Vacuolar sorting 38 and autophagy-related subunit 14 [Popillia japonica]|uniref:Vacuolar sorting 38 and autophagy-related subunit 14 n=1 Tax=Popillia japonica TaxID=7064 RepID=A0AAW1IZC6_POPJA